MFNTPRVSPPTRKSLLKGISVFRVLAAIGFSTVFGFELILRNVRTDFTPEVARPWTGTALVVAGLLATLILTLIYRRNWQLLTTTPVVAGEAVVACVMIGSGPYVFGFNDHMQSLPSIWVIAVVGTVALAYGTGAAIAAGLSLGVVRYVAWVLLEYEFLHFTPLASMVQLAVAGGVFGYILTKLATADRSVSNLKAREEVARTLHDGVLQTLAIIQRRGTENDLVELARFQELELREYLFGDHDKTETQTDLAAGLRSAAKTAERRHTIKIGVVCAPDLPKVRPELVHAIKGAVTESLTNACVHGKASSAHIYAEPDSTPIAETGSGRASVFVSVKDNGFGFSPDDVNEGEGLARSIRGRIQDVGGKVEIDGNLGRGCEIKIWA